MRYHVVSGFRVLPILDIRVYCRSMCYMNKSNPTLPDSHLHLRHKRQNFSWHRFLQIKPIFMLLLSTLTFTSTMKTNCMHSSYKYQEINNISKPDERLFIIGLVISLAPSARSFPSISLSNRGSYRRHSEQEVSRHSVTGWLLAFSHLLQHQFKYKEAGRKDIFTCTTPGDFTNLLMISDPFCGQRNCELMHP